MALIRFTNVLALLTAKGIDPSTNVGHNAMVNWVLECVPNCTTVAYYPESDSMDIVDSYVQPSRLYELGEVQSIDYSIW